MTSRNYDVILSVANTVGFATGNLLVGNTSATLATIAGSDRANNTIKVKLANVLQEFIVGEAIHSNAITIVGTANGALNNASALPFTANLMSGNTTVATTTITNTAPSSFIAAKNAFTQNPIVRLYSIYYPGEWYPANDSDNPTQKGEGRSWPVDFPIRMAEIVGDIADDISYNVTYGGTSYAPFPISLSGIEQSSDGKINELTVTMFNVDNIISTLVENPYLAGNNTANSTMAHVNGELVHGIDPRTVDITLGEAAVISQEMFDTLTRARANGLLFNNDVVAQYGKHNAAFTYSQTEFVNGTWLADKEDSRDMLGAVVNIKTTFANFLDYWPEYSLITAVNSNVITVRNSTPYRVGDNVKSSKGSAEATIQFIDLNHNIFISNNLPIGTAIGDPLYIVNEEADVESFIEDRFKIDQLESLSDHVATFGLVSWLQYFKAVVPKRKYYKNTCQWVYKGAECQYPGPGGLPIPGTTLTSNTNSIGLDNRSTSTRSRSLINMSTWVVGSAPPTNYTNNGDGNSLILDSTPYGDLGVLWDVSNQDAASDADGGFESSKVSIDPSKMYRYSVWIRRKRIGNGSTYLGTRSYDYFNNLQSIVSRSGTSSSNPYFISGYSWPLTAGSWYLLTGHVWPYTSGIGSAMSTSGIYTSTGTKILSSTDWVWSSLSNKSVHRAYLFYSTDTSTNQQFYNPRIDIIDGSEPTIDDLLYYKPAQLDTIVGADICSKSFAACTVRNNQIHFGGFYGVGRTVPRA